MPPHLAALESFKIILFADGETLTFSFLVWIAFTFSPFFHLVLAKTSSTMVYRLQRFCTEKSEERAYSMGAGNLSASYIHDKLLISRIYKGLKTKYQKSPV